METNQRTYFRLTIKNVPQFFEEELTSLCFENEAQGVSEKLEFTQERDDYQPITIEKDFLELNVYFYKPPAKEFLFLIQKKFPEIEVVVFEEQNKDWLKEWKKGFEAFCLVKNHWVVPSWKSPPKEAKYIIMMDPGMAFGTGTHETTQLASLLITNLGVSQKTVLDVGTGTAILGILCSQLDAKRIVGIEMEPVARTVGRKNVELNKILNMEIYDEQIETLDGNFDVVIANIIDGILLNIQKDLRRLVASGGHLVLTGILEERFDSFIESFVLEDFKVLKRQDKGEWVGLLLKRGF